MEPYQRSCEKFVLMLSKSLICKPQVTSPLRWFCDNLSMFLGPLVCVICHRFSHRLCITNKDPAMQSCAWSQSKRASDQVAANLQASSSSLSRQIADLDATFKAIREESLR
jgi:hypothetical protein